MFSKNYVCSKMGSLSDFQSENLEEKIIQMPNLEYKPEPGGMGKFFFSKMTSYGNAIAQIDGLTGEKDTYNSLLQRSIRTAITMRSKGITSKDIITICSFNHLNSCVPFISGLFLGVKTASLDPTISPNDTVHLLKQVKPKMIFVGPEAVKLIENAMERIKSKAEIVVFGPSANHLEFANFLRPSPEEEGFKPIEVADLKETAAIFFSSGTTGLPKGICLNHFALLSQTYQIRSQDCYPDIILAFASMYWISTTLLLTCCMHVKGCRLVVPKYDANIIWDLISNFKVTTLFMATSQAVEMYKKGRPKGINTSHLSKLLVGGQPISNDQILTLQEVLPGTNIIVGYGQTEISGCATIFLSHKESDMKIMKQRSGSSGLPIAGFTYKVVDPETEEVLGPNQRGELRLKTEFQMNGYLGIDSSNAWDSEGYIKTGDVVYYDEDRCFYIVDRIKEMLKYQSWHVPPAVIEAVLLAHPKVESAVVVGLPHPEDGDHPMGIVKLRNFINDVSEEEIEQYVAERVDDRQKLRGGIKIIKSIPVTPSGKIKRQDIRNMVLEGVI